MRAVAVKFPGMARNARPSKFGNKKTAVDGFTFDSKREANRYKDLRLLEADKQVRNLKRQAEYRLEIGGELICKYRADFVYDELVRREWVEVVEDAKGYRTDIYKLKKRLMKVLLGITVRET